MLGKKTLATPIFGYSVSFTDAAGETGWYGEEARNGNLRRCWDISMPQTLEQPLWNGCARRAINGYIPVSRVRTPGKVTSTRGFGTRPISTRIPANRKPSTIWPAKIDG